MEFEGTISQLAQNCGAVLNAVLVDGRHVQIAVAIADTMKTLNWLAEYHGITAAEIAEVMTHGQ